MNFLKLNFVPQNGAQVVYQLVARIQKLSKLNVINRPTLTLVDRKQQTNGLYSVISEVGWIICQLSRIKAHSIAQLDKNVHTHLYT